MQKDSRRSIVVVGSTNTDMVIKVRNLPAPGQTVLGGEFFMNPGGKGANQAVAAARLGGNVTFVCKTGNDVFGNKSAQLFRDEGINTSNVLSDADNPSGVALILIDENGQNCIAVAPGANGAMTTGDLGDAVDAIKAAAIVLLQLEIPINVVEHVIRVASSSRVMTVLNPAPAHPLTDELLRATSILTPNETEAETLTGVRVADIQSAEKAARVLHDRGVKIVIITLGAQGALVLDHDKVDLIPAPKVTAVDTTAAGDIFNGALVTALAEGSPLRDAVAFACRASAISVTRLGAQSSAPYRRELNEH
ncbi:MAG TPA: ribokinase [Candidatus Kryptonia bacterium]